MSVTKYRNRCLPGTPRHSMGSKRGRLIRSQGRLECNYDENSLHLGRPSLRRIGFRSSRAAIDADSDHHDHRQADEVQRETNFQKEAVRQACETGARTGRDSPCAATATAHACAAVAGTPQGDLPEWIAIHRCTKFHVRRHPLRNSPRHRSNRRRPAHFQRSHGRPSRTRRTAPGCRSASFQLSI